uniref:Ubiquitin-like domain-containing protein n=1 Tax=Ascaris lumbricoides TaxID=6252 RepID=A0A0M3HY68_ASCLU
LKNKQIVKVVAVERPFLAPGAYDPYNRVSYLQINKAKRGDGERPENERIYNRPPPTVKKIFLKPNGDARFSSQAIEYCNFRPRLFVWRVWRIPRLESLVKEAGEFLGFEEGVAQRLYDLKGHLIDDEDQIHDGSTYIVAGSEPLDLEPRLFVWRVWRIPRLESLVKEAGEFLGFEEGVAQRLYDLKGHLIDDEDQIHDGSTYIVAGSEPLDLE